MEAINTVINIISESDKSPNSIYINGRWYHKHNKKDLKELYKYLKNGKTKHI